MLIPLAMSCYVAGYVTTVYNRVVQPYCRQGPDNLSDCLRGPDCGLFYITVERDIIGNVSKHVNVSTLTSNLDIVAVADFIVFSQVISERELKFMFAICRLSSVVCRL